MSLKPATFLLASLLASTAVHASETPWAGLTPPPKLADPATPSQDLDAPFALRAAEPRTPSALGAPAGGGPSVSASKRAPEFRSGRSKQAGEQAAAPAKVDESALRFYASQNDTARVSMEIKRITTLYPTWQPPADLFDEPRNTADEQRLWDLFGAGRFDEIRAVVEEIQAQNPSWRPSEEFVSKFERAEAGASLVAASNAGDAMAVLSIAESNPNLLICSEMDVLWRTAEALVQTGAPERAQELYRYILTRCTDPAERLATVQKASVLLPPGTVEKLMALGSRRTDGAGEFEPVRLDLVRKRIGTLASDPGAEPLQPNELRSFETLVMQRKLTNDAALLGWLRYGQKDWAGAAQWFKQSIAWERTPKATEGYALALRQQGHLNEAEAITYEWRKADPLIEKLYIEIVATALTEPQPDQIEADRLKRIEAVVGDAKSANGAQALGWYAYNTGAFQSASAWFSKSVEWDANETNVLGLALATHRAKDRAAFQRVVAEFGGRYPAIAALKTYDRAANVRTKGGRAGGGQAGKLAQDAVALFKSGKYREALATLDKRAAIAREDRGLSVLRGWSHYHLTQYDKALTQFSELDRRSSNRDTQYGLYYSQQKLSPTPLRD